MGLTLNSNAPLTLQGCLQSAGQQKKIELWKLTTSIARKHAKKSGGREANFRRWSVDDSGPLADKLPDGRFARGPLRRNIRRIVLSRSVSQAIGIQPYILHELNFVAG